MFKKIFLTIFAALFLLLPNLSWARGNVTDWYIQDFDSQILVNKDSSLDITETITADCGMAGGKHGIFRILPTRIEIAGEKVQTPVKLLGITDQAGNAYAYQTIKNSSDGTVTWKIGDAKKTVQGVNVYVIHYQVQNAIRFGGQKFDELYWNLNGNFWDLQIDNLSVTLLFPKEVDKQTSKVEYYAGNAGSKEKSLAAFQWSQRNVLEFNSTRTLLERQGVTASVTFPKDIFVPYQPSFWDLYGQYLPFLIPMLILIVTFSVWLRYGKDPVIDKPIIAEYEIPAKLTPLEAGMLMKGGAFSNSFITAEIIWLATRGLVSIKETESKFLFFSSKNYTLTRNRKLEVEALLTGAQKKILKNIFKEGEAVELSSLKNSFYRKIGDIAKTSRQDLKNKGLILTKGFNIGIGFGVLGLLFLFFGFFSFSAAGAFWGFSLIISGLILIGFAIIMPKRTSKGAQLNWQIKGFKLFMETVDRDRAAFYEKENIFEKCLPYAILFGMTSLWIRKMQELYGEQYFASHIPVWYTGSLASFEGNNFATAMNSLSASIAASTSSPSGSGGAGSSGGGGGGGGGGG
ncbi:MAG: DUF2207 domain-containing protein, partial [Candidatus Moraniibacteriota bacterium]